MKTLETVVEIERLVGRCLARQIETTPTGDGHRVTGEALRTATDLGEIQRLLQNVRVDLQAAVREIQRLAQAVG